MEMSGSQGVAAGWTSEAFFSPLIYAIFMKQMSTRSGPCVRLCYSQQAYHALILFEIGLCICGCFWLSIINSWHELVKMIDIHHSFCWLEVGDSAQKNFSTGDEGYCAENEQENRKSSHILPNHQGGRIHILKLDCKYFHCIFVGHLNGGVEIFRVLSLFQFGNKSGIFSVVFKIRCKDRSTEAKAGILVNCSKIVVSADLVCITVKRTICFLKPNTHRIESIRFEINRTEHYLGDVKTRSVELGVVILQLLTGSECLLALVYLLAHKTAICSEIFSPTVAKSLVFVLETFSLMLTVACIYLLEGSIRGDDKRQQQQGVHIKFLKIKKFQSSLYYQVVYIRMSSASLLLLLVVSAFAMSTSDSVSNTYVTEIIIPFDMPMSDLSIAAKNQLSRNDFKTNSFSGENITVSNLIYKSSYNGTQRTVDPPGQSSRHVVTGDALDMLITYQAVLHPKLPTRKTVNGSTTLKIYLNYTKEIDTATGVTQFENLAMFVDPSSFKMTYSGSPTAAEKKILDGINNGSNAGKSIWHLLRDQQFSKQVVLEYFIDNLQQQKLSPTYDSTYEYTFEGFNITFDMRTAKVENVEHGIANILKGSIKGFTSEVKDNTIIIPKDSDYHTLYSVGFIRNFLQYNIEHNTQWRNFKADRSKYIKQGISFGFRLVDLEYVLQEISQKHSQYYLEDIQINCSPSQIRSIGIDEVNDQASLRLDWACKGVLLSQKPYPVILDFDIGLTYIIQLFCSKGYLSVLIKKTYFDKIDFRPVADFQIVNTKLAEFYAKEMIGSIFGYTVGTNFQVKGNSSKLALKQNEGIWVG